ncbi:polysaccharide deacetylase family protein [Flavobacterium sp. 3HN19-14]|uniref:polysaccharide deacetylase family protein n=1 Tax=Flavobacterium sp. 3HN19-14 TaxID=3448133 RepID=UPI003EDF24A5
MAINKQHICRIAFYITFLLMGFNIIAQNEIGNYKVALGVVDYNNHSNIVLRKFIKKGNPFFVIVNPDNLETSVIPSEGITFEPSDWPQITEKFKKTPYIQSLETAKKQSLSTEDSGIVHGYPKEHSITLTIDLCPSHKPLDRVIFSSLINEFKKTEKPVPVGLSITGRFMLTHQDDLLWLEGLVKSGDINITWINHTYNHHFNPKKPVTDNFLLAPNTDVSFEIIGTEIALLQRGLVFSAFFRFPGLVSSPKLIDQVAAFGLIPIGSDAWLAKGQQAQSGSIVLIHGNGNEPVGVKDFINLLHTENDAVMKKQWLLYDLRESVENEFQE